jgi:hypothetical protein
VDRLRVILEESKLYGMILAISAIVWIAGFWARIEQRWHETVWMAPPSDVHVDTVAGVDFSDPDDFNLE